MRGTYPGSECVSVSVKGVRFPARPYRELGLREQMQMMELGSLTAALLP